MRLLRIVVGLPLACFALAYMGIGALFMTGAPPYNTREGTVLAITGLAGFCLPVALFGVHLAVSGPNRPERLGRLLVAVLVAGFCVGVGGSLYALSRPELRADAAELLQAILICTVLFGGPIVLALFRGKGR